MYIAKSRAIFSITLFLMLAIIPGNANASAGHSEGENKGHGMMDNMRKEHQSHKHKHNFSAMEEMPPKQLQHMIELMREIGIGLPPMDARRGRKTFVNKGCVVCHTVNGVGVEIGPSLDAANMPSPMNAFEFAARMWRGASAMTKMQEDLFGETISLTGQELADLVAFAHDEEEQKKLTKNQIPKNFLKMMSQ